MNDIIEMQEIFILDDILEDINQTLISEDAFIQFLNDFINLTNPTEDVNSEDASIFAVGVTFAEDPDFDHFYEGQDKLTYVAALVRRFIALKNIIHYLPEDLTNESEEKHVKNVLPCVLRAAIHAEVRQEFTSTKAGVPKFDLANFVELARQCPRRQ